MWILPALLAGLAFFQDPVQQTVVVTGSYQPLPLNETDRSLHVHRVTKTSALLVNTVSDLFKEDSSLDTQERSPNGIQGDLSIRGGTFGQTLVLINGMRFNDAQSAHHNLDIPIPTEAVGQVEILSGSGSTQYGADAVGGVVNVVTRRPEALEASLRAALGNFGTNQERLTVGGGTKAFSELASASRDFSTGFTNDRDYRNLSLSSSTMLADPWGPASVLLTLRDTPFGANQFYGNYDSWERTKAWFAAAHQNIGENTEADFAFRRHTDLFVLYRENPAYYTNRHADESWEGSVRRTDDGPWGGKLHYGAEFDADSLQSNNLGVHARNREAIYADYDLRSLARYSLNLGLRDDIYAGFKNQLSPNISGAAWLSPRVKLRAAVSRSFRLPTFTDLYYSDPATLGNAHLKPETAWSYEGGLDWHASAKWNSALTFFQRHDANLIDYVQTNPAQKYVATNFQRLVFTGLEATARRVGGFYVAYTYLHGNRTLEAGAISRYAFNYPVHNGVAGWEGNLRWGLIGRTRLGAQQRLGQSPYAVWDASLAYSKGRIQPFLQLSNFTGTDYRTLPNVAQPGRGVVGGVKISALR